MNASAEHVIGKTNPMFSNEKFSWGSGAQYKEPKKCIFPTIKHFDFTTHSS